MSRIDTGYILVRKSDGAHPRYGKVRYSTQGANQALWEWVTWRITGRLTELYGYDDDTTWSIQHVCRTIHRDKCSLDAANQDLATYQIGSMPNGVSKKQAKQYTDARLEIYNEWEIVKVKVA